jgi:hypothetical protein
MMMLTETLLLFVCCCCCAPAMACLFASGQAQMYSEGAAYGQARGGGTSAEVAERLASIRQVRGCCDGSGSFSCMFDVIKQPLAQRLCPDGLLIQLGPLLDVALGRVHCSALTDPDCLAQEASNDGRILCCGWLSADPLFLAGCRDMQTQTCTYGHSCNACTRPCMHLFVAWMLQMMCCTSVALVACLNGSVACFLLAPNKKF